MGIGSNWLVLKLKAELNSWPVRKREFNLEFPYRSRTRKKSPHPYTEIWLLHENLLANFSWPMVRHGLFSLTFPGYSASKFKELALKNFPFPFRARK